MLRGNDGQLEDKIYSGFCNKEPGMKTKIVKDIMMPLSEYAIVPEEATLKEALMALRDAQLSLPPERHRHRVVMVQDGSGKIIGKLGHHGFLAALDPKFHLLNEVENLSYPLIDVKSLEEEMDELGFWEDKLSLFQERADSIKIKEVMKKVEEHIDENGSLTEAIHLLIRLDVLSLVVEKDNNVVGLIRLSDLFQEISDYILGSD